MVLHGIGRRSCILGECMARQQAQNACCLGPGGQILKQRMPHVALALHCMRTCVFTDSCSLIVTATNLKNENGTTQTHLPPLGQRAWQRG